MKKPGVVIIVLLLVGLVVASDSFAQRGAGFKWRGSGGWGPGTPYQRLFNPTTVETITGTVEAVESVVPMKGMYSGVALLVKTDKGTIPVHLGPAWYIERLDTKIAKGDTIEVKGSRVEFAGKPAILAAEVKKGDNVLTLRNEAGVPVWAGWGWRR